MKTWIATALMFLTLAGTCSTATAQSPQQQQQQQQSDALVSALNHLLDQLTSSADADVPQANTFDGNAAAAKKQKKDTAVAVGTGAAIGSAIGAMMSKEDRGKGAAIGAAIGGIAGYIYDRMHKAEEATNATQQPQPPQQQQQQQPQAQSAPQIQQH